MELTWFSESDEGLDPSKKKPKRMKPKPIAESKSTAPDATNGNTKPKGNDEKTTNEVTSDTNRGPLAITSKSPLLALPAELRVEIYKFAFAGGTHCRCDDEQPDIDWTQPPRIPDALSLPSTCRQIWNETQPYKYTMLTLCGKPHHNDGLRRMAETHPEALQGIRVLNLNIDYHSEQAWPNTVAYESTMHWTKTLIFLNWERMCLEELGVNFFCAANSAQCDHASSPMQEALVAMESCRLFRFTGIFDNNGGPRLLDALKNFNIFELPPRPWPHSVNSINVYNPLWKLKWNKVQAFVKALREKKAKDAQAAQDTQATLALQATQTTQTTQDTQAAQTAEETQTIQETSYCKDCIVDGQWYSGPRSEQETGRGIHQLWRVRKALGLTGSAL